MFLNSIMLVGMGAAVVPLVLHLLSRARYKDVEWGAMMFLDGADAQRRQSARFNQVFLLLLRTVLIALLALALARPVMRGKLGGQESEGRVTAALLLDCSASMGFEENGRSRFQMAQAAARQIIRGLRPGDQVALILMGAARNTGEREPTGDLRAIEARIDEAKVGYGSANIRDSLEQAADILGRYEKNARDLYLVCDHQSLSWKNVDAQFAAEWKTRMQGPGLNSRMYVLAVGNADADNIAIESARLVNPPAIAGQPCDIEVIVHNYGPLEHSAVPVSLNGGGLDPPEKSVNLAGGQSVPVSFSGSFGQTGSQLLTAKIKNTGNMGDKQLDLAVNVIGPINVLIISGDERAAQFRSESDFLKWALAPHQSAGVSGADPCSVTVLSADAWSGTDLEKYRVVILANIERFTSQQAHALEKYVYSGGRLLVAPGSLSRVDDYNAQLYRDGAGVLPAMLQSPTSTDGSESTSLLGMQTDHPIFQFLRGRFEIPSATIARYCPAIPRQVDADVLARYLNNDPFLIEGRSERGRVLLMTTALDADWSTLPLSNFYLPFVQSAVRYLAGSTLAQGNLSPGEAIHVVLDDHHGTRPVTLTRPDGRLVKFDGPHRETLSEFRYADTEIPGTYRLQAQGPDKTLQTIYFVVKAPGDESDLTPLSEERWQWLERSLGCRRIDPAGNPITEMLPSQRQGKELWGYMLPAILGLIGVEMYVARCGVMNSDMKASQERLEL